MVVETVGEIVADAAGTVIGLKGVLAALPLLASTGASAAAAATV